MMEQRFVTAMVLARRKRVRIHHMPRSARRATTGPYADALDIAVAEYNEAEARLAEKHKELIAAMALAVRKNRMPKAEAARRAGYSREHGSKLIDEWLSEHAEEL